MRLERFEVCSLREHAFERDTDDGLCIGDPGGIRPNVKEGCSLNQRSHEKSRPGFDETFGRFRGLSNASAINKDFWEVPLQKPVSNGNLRAIKKPLGGGPLLKVNGNSTSNSCQRSSAVSAPAE